MRKYLNRKQAIELATERGFDPKPGGKTRLVVYGPGNSYVEFHWPTNKAGWLTDGPAAEYAAMAFPDHDLVRKITKGA